MLSKARIKTDKSLCQWIQNQYLRPFQCACTLNISSVWLSLCLYFIFYYSSRESCLISRGCTSSHLQDAAQYRTTHGWMPCSQALYQRKTETGRRTGYGNLVLIAVENLDWLEWLHGFKPTSIQSQESFYILVWVHFSASAPIYCTY